MKRKYIYIVLLLGAVGFASYWFTREDNNRGGAEEILISDGQVVLNAQIISNESFSNMITLSGTIEPDEQVQIRSEISGVIRELAFQEGTYVNKGQMLIRIDDSELQALLIQAQSREKLTEDNEKRAKLLLEKEAISIQEYDVSYADYQSAKAQTSLIEAQIAKTRVNAPFSGRIGLRSVSEGEYLTPTNVVAHLLSVEKVKILFAIPEKYSGQIKAGHPLQFTASNSDRMFDAKVYAVEPGVDENTRTIRIRAVADNSHGLLVPGAFVRIELPLERIEDAILIPTYAVLPVQNGKQVYLYRSGKSIATSVITENRTQYDVVVKDGVKPGDTLITSGLMNIRDGSSVTVQIVEPDLI